MLLSVAWLACNDAITVSVTPINAYTCDLSSTIIYYRPPVLILYFIQYNYRPVLKLYHTTSLMDSLRDLLPNEQHYCFYCHI